MNTKEVNTKTSVNWIQVNKDGTNSYFGKLAAQWLFNENLQSILAQYHKNKRGQYSCHLHVWDCSDLNNPFLAATQKSDMRADSYMTEDRVMVILEWVALDPTYNKNLVPIPD